MIEMAVSNVYMLHRGPSILKKLQKVGLAALRRTILPTMTPMGCILDCRYPASTGSYSYFTAAASSATSPMLTNRTILNRIPIVAMYSYCFSAINARGKVRAEVINRHKTIQNFLRP
jgi:hypothetical protein